MAAYNVTQSINATLSGTTVDVLTLLAPYGTLQVVNRDTTTIWVTAGRAPADPVALAAGAIPVPAGEAVNIAEHTPIGWVVKIVGNGQAYTVQGLAKSNFGASDNVVNLSSILTTVDRTFALGDPGRMVEADSASPLVLTVPTHEAVPIPVGSIIGIYRKGSGTVTVAPAGGVTVRRASSLFAQYSEASLRKRDLNEWVMIGDVV